MAGDRSPAWPRNDGGDVVFVVRRSGAAGGRKIGELRISQGGIEWFPRQTRRRCTKSWEQLERLLRC